VSVEPTEVVVRIDAAARVDEEVRVESAVRVRENPASLEPASAECALAMRPFPSAECGEVVAWRTALVAIASSGALTAAREHGHGADRWSAAGNGQLKIVEEELGLAGASSEDPRRVIDDSLARRVAGVGSDG
jgi:hypothetical protein